MTLCRTCNQPWVAQGSLLTVCPACRSKLPVRRVNTKTDKPWRPLQEPTVLTGPQLYRKNIKR